MTDIVCQLEKHDVFPSGRLNFTRDQSGLINTISEDLAMTVNYDPDLQISSIIHTSPQAFSEDYTYDDNGNRVTSLSNSFIYDDLNRLTESTTHEYAYDADGNMTKERNKITGETKKYYWDSENRMVKYEHLATDISPVDTTALYKYDIYGRRIQKDVNGNVINFMWEGDSLSLELNAANQPIRKYFTEMGMDDYFAHLEYSEITNWGQLFIDSYPMPMGWYGYIKDQVGTIYKVWDKYARQVVDNRTYDSFGNLVNQSGTTKTPLGFQGKYYDQESGLNYFYHRYYNPTIGRFTSEDPIHTKGGINFYTYVWNNPIKFTDYFGLKAGDICPNIVVKRNNIHLSGDDKYGHWWIECGNESYGWWPKCRVDSLQTLFGVQGELNGQTAFGGTKKRDPHHGDTAEVMFNPQISDSPGCECKSCAEAEACIRRVAAAADIFGGEWSWPRGPNCHTFQESVMSQCCLKK